MALQYFVRLTVVFQSRRGRKIAQAMRQQTQSRNNGSIGLASREQDDPTDEATVTAPARSAQDKQMVAKTAGPSAAKGPLTDVFRTTVLKVPTQVCVARVPGTDLSTYQ